MFCHNIPGLVKELGFSIYSPNEWRMFIDSSKQSLKCFLLHNSFYLVQSVLGILSVFAKKNTIRSSVLTLKWCSSFLVSNVGTQNITGFSVCGIVELERSIELRRVGLQDLIVNLEILTFYMSHLLTGRK